MFVKVWSGTFRATTVNIQITEHSSYRTRAAALYMAQPYGALTTGAANNDLNAHRVATHEGSQARRSDHETICAWGVSTGDTTCSAETPPSTDRVVSALKESPSCSPHLVMI